GICGVEPGPGYDGVSYTFSILCLAHTLVLGFNSRDALLAWDARVRYSLGEGQPLVSHNFIMLEKHLLEISKPTHQHDDALSYIFECLAPCKPDCTQRCSGREPFSLFRSLLKVKRIHRFSVNVEPGTKLECGPASLHLCNNLLVLTRGVPPVVIGHWKLSALRRYGAVPNGFVFEGGTRCGYWAGVFFLSCSEGEQISLLFDCMVRGITPSRTPHGLRPVLPADPNADPESAEKRISQEASELEKRLSMLSHCSLASSTASTYSCSTSVAGDDQSSISSSSSSQSDASYGSRLPFGVEPLSRTHLSKETLSSSSTLNVLTSSDDRLYAAVMCPSSAQLHPRCLHDSGRQSSLDSGIGIVTGSQSSYSGSVSSYTGSLDMAGQGGEGEFGSVASLLAPPHSPSTPPAIHPPTPPLPPPPFQSTLTPEHRSATSPCPCSSRSSSRASPMHSEEYQFPSLLRVWYDTPRSLLHTLSLRDQSVQESPPELARDSRSSRDGVGSQGQRYSPKGLRAQRQVMMQRSRSWGSERAPSVDSEGRSTPRPLLVPGGS
ncbi:hypothetical protein FQN60_011680, partial [Etheostoma spectabile]